MNKLLTHIAGTFLVQADSAFLNGAGLGEGEDRNVTVPKTFRDGRGEVPYVSAQAWKRWLRNTMIEETGWPASEARAVGWNPRGNVKKIATHLNPVDMVEDDIFGYMRAEAGQGRTAESEEEEEESVTVRTKSVMRASPFVASLLVSLRSTRWEGRDEGFVHLAKYDPQALAQEETERFLSTVSSKRQDKHKSVWERLEEFGDDFAKMAKSHADKNELDALRVLLLEKAKEKGKEVSFVENPCSPLPYTTRFYNTHLQGIFCLNYGRLGVYWNLGDRIELDESKVKSLLSDKKIVDVTLEEPYKTLSENGKIGRIFKITDKVKPTSRERAHALFKSLAVLRGGAKQAQFGTDVSPKVLILAGLTCGNPIFNHLFKDDQEGPTLRIETFKEILKDYADRIVTPVLVGIRSGYLRNEDEVRKLNETTVTGGEENTREIKVSVMTPVEAAQEIGKYLP